MIRRLGAAADFPVRSQPAVVDGVVYFGGPDGKFYARTGAAKWTFDLTGVEPGPWPAVAWDGPAVANGKVYFGDIRGYVYALNQRDGRLVWPGRRGPEARRLPRVRRPHR